ncbi:histidine kinase [Phytomonospora sp. NPDC050363]|uniref:sensor histidine kinase n=1 Tax=Phytomonospora sp. NPDC050363 TaxID=3155642 RepID=UPI0033CF5A5F
MEFRRTARVAITAAATVTAFATAAPVIAASASTAIGAALLARRPATLFWSAITATAVSVSATCLYSGGDDNRTGPWWFAETVALCALLFGVTARLPVTRALPAGSALLAATAVSPLRLWLRLDPPSPPGELALLTALWTASGLLAVGAGLYRRGHARRRAGAIEAARRAQRVALARDLHDFVAHDVSGIVVLAQAALHVGETNPAQAMDALRRIERAGLGALSTLDRTVHALHTDGPAQPPAGLDTLTELLDRFADTGSTTAITSIDPSLSGLPPAPAAAAHRIVAEGLTNVRAHAPGALAVRVTLARDGADLLVELANDLPARGRLGLRAREHGGLGLAGLDELVTALGGRLTAGPDADGGWLLSARIPLATGEDRA